MSVESYVHYLEQSYSIEGNSFRLPLFRSPIPTKDHLIDICIIPIISHMGASGCGSIENVDNLFLNCDFFGSIEPLLACWLGMVYHFSKSVRSLLHLIWLSTMLGNLKE